MDEPVSSTSSPVKRDASSTSGAPIALTTTFTPSSSCLNELWRTVSDSWTWMRLGPPDTANCLPSGWSSNTYYSPGICPSGWLMAYSETVIVSSSAQTVGTCCPQYLKGSETWEFTRRPSSSSTKSWYSTELCQWSPTTEIAYFYTYSDTQAETTTTELSRMTSGGIWNAYGIEIRWQSTDSATPATAAATTTPVATTTQSQSLSKSPDVSSGLQTSAKVGIGIGVSAGGILILFVLGFFILRHKRRQGRQTQQFRTHELVHQDSKQPFTELLGDDGAAKVQSNQPQELAVSARPNARSSNGWQNPAELDGRQGPAELDVPGSTRT